MRLIPLPPTLFLTNLFLTKCWSCLPPSLPWNFWQKSWHFRLWIYLTIFSLRGAVKKPNSIFKDIFKIEVDKFIFDKVLIMFTSLHPQKSWNFRLWNLHSLLSLLLSEGQGYRRKDTESLGWATLSNKSYKIECFYFWQCVVWPPPSPTFVKKSFLFNF